MQTPAGFPAYGILVKASTMYVFIFFFKLALTTETMGILRCAGASLSPIDKVNAGANNSKCTSAGQ